MAIKKEHSISTAGTGAGNGTSSRNGTNSRNGHNGKYAHSSTYGHSSFRPRITNYKQLLYDEFHRLTAQHQKAVSEGASAKELKKLMREISDTAGMLQSLSSDLDV